MSIPVLGTRLVMSSSLLPLPGSGPHRTSPGFGLGLRTAHYQDFLAARQPVEWLEVITDNFLVDGGKPLAMLETFRRDYPVALHGVAMSLGSARGLNPHYLQRVRRLADRFEALWVSDHLCWTGPAQQPLHDLYPLPYTEECARLLIHHIRQAQDMLGRRLVVENVSSYLRYSASGVSEWDFLAHVVREADCELLVDVNNIYVSSVNHGFDPLDYLRAMPAERVRQIHLAGHSMTGHFIIDTHDHPVCEAVWQLYAQAIALFGPTATMIERDDHIPPLADLLAELTRAREMAEAAIPNLAASARPQTPARFAPPPPSLPDLDGTQWLVGALVLAPQPIPTNTALPEALDDTQARDHVNTRLSGHRGLEIYHNAYRARLSDVLADHLPKTQLYVGSEHFEELALAYVEQHPPVGAHLGRYGECFAQHLATVYPDHPVLRELAELEWAMRTVFDAADQPAWRLTDVQEQGPEGCFHQWPILHPTVNFLAQHSNALNIWRAIHNDEDVPEPSYRATARHLLVWRRDQQPHFCSLDEEEVRFLQALQQKDHSIALVAEQQCDPMQPEQLGEWLRQWWQQEWLLRMPS